VASPRSWTSRARKESPLVETISIARESDIVTARLAGAPFAERAGLTGTQAHCLKISISELASNILRYAGAGTITIRLVTDPAAGEGVEVIADDQGKGIDDVRLACQDGYSTGGGMGGGLSGVCRLMSEMTISSALNKGTTVRAVKWAMEPPELG